MRWAKNLYVTEKISKKKDIIIRKANRGAGMFRVYFVSLASNEENLFDIFHSAHIKQHTFYQQNPFVVGIASGYEDALELVQRIIHDIYSQTGSFRVREYFGAVEQER